MNIRRGWMNISGWLFHRRGDVNIILAVYFDRTFYQGHATLMMDFRICIETKH
jgi:hypothetical protein